MMYAKIEDRMYDIKSTEDFYKNRSLLQSSSVAVNITDNNHKCTLPYKEKGSIMDQPGIYNVGDIDIIVYPDNPEDEKYNPDIIDFNNISDMKEFQEKKKELDEMENKILMDTDPDNIFHPPLLETDTPEMRAIKEAITAKNIDLDKYADRYGTNYPNDKRKYKDNNITITLIKRACECLDMKAQLIIEDKSPDVANPIGRKIIADLTSGFDDE